MAKCKTDIGPTHMPSMVISKQIPILILYLFLLFSTVRKMLINNSRRQKSVQVRVAHTLHKGSLGADMNVWTLKNQTKLSFMKWRFSVVLVPYTFLGPYVKFCFAKIYCCFVVQTQSKINGKIL